MLFYEYFKTLISSHIIVSLKNGMVLSGLLVDVDPFLNLTLDRIQVEQGDDALADLQTCSIRGSAVKLIRFRGDAAVIQRVVDATRLRCCLGNN